MSVSENSTLLPFARDNEGSYQLLDGHAYGLGGLPVNSYKQSPYTDPDIISLHFGVSQTSYRVHRVLLSQSTELDLKIRPESTEDTISLPELDEISAHTLVHYLYTGKYQALESYELGKDGAFSGYKLGACVYCAATRYKLFGLAELAKEKITSFGEDLGIMDILSVARERVFPGLLDDESWFSAYLEGAIMGAVLEDPDLFTRPEFVDQIEGDRKYRRVVMKAIVNTYSRGQNAFSARQTELSTPVAEPTFVEQTFEDPFPTDTKKPEDLDLEPIEPLEKKEELPTEAAHAPNFIQEVAIQPKANEPTAESPQAPEPFTDELGFATSKTYQNQKLGNQSEKMEPETVADSRSQTPIHIRSDSVMQFTDIVSAESLPVADEKTVAPPGPTEVIPVATDGKSDDAPVLKKKGKKGKKRASAVVVVSTEN